jgi:hypothetical protein
MMHPWMEKATQAMTLLSEPLRTVERRGTCKRHENRKINQNSTRGHRGANGLRVAEGG